jgi:hypothetical protein
MVIIVLLSFSIIIFINYICALVYIVLWVIYFKNFFFPTLSSCIWVCGMNDVYCFFSFLGNFHLFLFHHFWILILNVQATVSLKTEAMDNFMPNSLKSFDAFRESNPLTLRRRATPVLNTNTGLQPKYRRLIRSDRIVADMYQYFLL